MEETRGRLARLKDVREQRGEGKKKTTTTCERPSEVREAGVHVHLEVNLLPGAACYLISARQTLSLAPSRQQIIQGPTSKHPPGFKPTRHTITPLHRARRRGRLKANTNAGCHMTERITTPRPLRYGALNSRAVSN